jgi:hypothetical protein
LIDRTNIYLFLYAFPQAAFNKLWWRQQKAGVQGGLLEVFGCSTYPPALADRNKRRGFLKLFHRATLQIQIHHVTSGTASTQVKPVNHFHLKAPSLQ